MVVDLILDDGSVTHLKPFDTVIQRGTNHEWVCTVRRQRPTLSTHSVADGLSDAVGRMTARRLRWRCWWTCRSWATTPTESMPRHGRYHGCDWGGARGHKRLALRSFLPSDVPSTVHLICATA